MKFEIVQRTIAGVPYISPVQARHLYDFLLASHPTDVLELGFAHGASSCYIAAALHELGRGSLTCVDLESSANREPNLEMLLERTGLADYVDIHREPNNYTWFLKKEVEGRTRGGTCEPIYDFCYLDGCKNWTVDGCAFFLVDKLLRPGGWILFDDYKWTYKKYERATGHDATDGLTHRKMAPDEYEVPHVEAVFRLLVMQHPDYSEFRVVDENWAFAHKVRAARRTLTIDTMVSPRMLASRLVRKVRNRYFSPRVPPIATDR